MERQRQNTAWLGPDRWRRAVRDDAPSWRCSKAYSRPRRWFSVSRAALALVGLLAAGALAGCSSGPKAQPAPSVDFTPLALQATTTTGVLRGLVVDPAVRPVAGVDLTGRGPGAADPHVASNAQGAFGLGR